MEDINVGNFRQNGLCDVILGSEEKTSDLATPFSRNSGASNMVYFLLPSMNSSLQLIAGRVVVSRWLFTLNFLILLMS